MKIANLSSALRRLARILLFGILAATAGSGQAIELVTFYHNDTLGSLVAATDTDASGTLLWRERHAPYCVRLTWEAGTVHILRYERYSSSCRPL